MIHTRAYATIISAMEILPHKPERNPITARTFRKQIALEVYLPLGLFVILLAAMVYVLWTLGVGQFGAWADISLVLLLIPLFLLGLLLLGLLIGLVYGLAVVISWLPYPARRGQDLLVRVQATTRKGADMVAKPFLVPGALIMALRHGLEYLLGIFRSPAR